MVRNEEMLLNIRDSAKTLRAVSNLGSQDHNQVGDLPGFFTVWYNPESKLNILAWTDVRKRFRIMSDTSVSNSIFVHLEDGRQMEFKEIQSGLYMWRPNSKVNLNNVKVSRYSFLNLVSTNKNMFTNEEIKRANLAKRLYQHIGAPWYSKFIKMIQDNYIRNCPVTVDDAKRAVIIYGRDIIKMKASSVRKKPQRLGVMAPLSIPDEVWEHHQTEMLNVDYFFAQNLAHFHAIGTTYKFRNIDAVTDKDRPSDEDIMVSVKKT